MGGIVAALLSLAVSAQAPECATIIAQPFTSQLASEGGPALRWPSRQMTYYVDAGGTEDIEGTRELTLAHDAFAAWAALAGARFIFGAGGKVSAVPFGYDQADPGANRSVLYFSQHWLHDATQQALTTLTFNGSTGEILDADIEVNDLGFEFGDGDGVRPDLGALLTHEAGHVLGFAHAEDTKGLPRDCALKATMYSQTIAGDEFKRTPQPSDAAGMRFVYPAGASGGCAQGAPTWWVSVLLVVARTRACFRAASRWSSGQRRPARG